jgi:uncharacterized HAD superfamily protein
MIQKEESLYYKLLKSSPKTLAFDIDGTITREIEGYTRKIYLNRTPRKKVINRIRKLHEAGHFIVLFTARYEEDEKITRSWLKKWNVPFHLLVFGKPMFHYLIDDRVENVREFVK